MNPNPATPAPSAARWRFDHINLHARDSAPLKTLFGDVMGLRPGYRPPFPFPGDWLYRDDQAWLHLVTAPPEQGAAVRFAHIAFRTDEPAAALLDRVRSAGLEHEVAVVPEDNCVQIFVRLPGGLVIELDADGAADDAAGGDYDSRLALAQSPE
jgi:catechol 2,3-dioxygenase-like lactoylglutathione lyase family enzyme